MSKGYKVPNDKYGRRCLTPHEFIDRTSRLRDIHTGISETSGSRSTVRNRRVGGKTGSKHKIRKHIAQDFSCENPNGSKMTKAQRNKLGADAVTLGLWFTFHDVGSGFHLHTQGLPVGPVPAIWWNRFGD